MISKEEKDNWSEVMELAQKYGFLIQAYGGAATLATKANQTEYFNVGKYEAIQALNRGEVPEPQGKK